MGVQGGLCRRPSNYTSVMTDSDKPQFFLLRSILRALGLSAEAVDDIIARIVDLLSDKDEPGSRLKHFPYQLRDDFLSPAEQSFYLVLKTAIGEWALICPKVSLGDLFFAKAGDPGEYRIYTNKIDRKHVDFLLCDPRTVKPLLGIELDDKSHQRADRQERDQFVEEVFANAKLPLVRVPAQRSYSATELGALLRQKAGAAPPQAPTVVPADSAPVVAASAPGTSTPPPTCPKCGAEMVLRTAKTGANQGGQFWGCSNYPRCRGIRSFDGKPS